jgi:hypothetical protein
MRSDIQGYYESIRFDASGIIESYIQHPILLKLIRNALRRTETLGQIQGVFYARYMDDWVVLTRSKTALRKVIKITHEVLNVLKFQLHHCKTYIGKISHGFNFLCYYMDAQKILPSQETTGVFGHELPRFTSRRKRIKIYPPVTKETLLTAGTKLAYQVNEPTPTDDYFQGILSLLLSLAAQRRDMFVTMRRYVGKWTRWLKLGSSTLKEFETSVQTLLPTIFSCWIAGAKVFALGCCQ